MNVKNAYGTNAKTIAIFPFPHPNPTVAAIAIIIMANSSFETLFTPSPNHETNPSMIDMACGAVPDVGGTDGGDTIL